jgi:hypothetical protein
MRYHRKPQFQKEQSIVAKVSWPSLLLQRASEVYVISLPTGTDFPSQQSIGPWYGPRLIQSFGQDLLPPLNEAIEKEKREDDIPIEFSIIFALVITRS